MADVTIGELPALAEMQDDALLPCEYDGTTYSMSGVTLEAYVYNSVEDHVEDIAAIIATGPQGGPGVSPTLSATKSGKVTTIYYTDVDHASQTVLATINDGQDGEGIGDMTKAVYDPEDEGVVVDSKKLNGQPASYYLNVDALGATEGVATLTSAGRLTPMQMRREGTIVSSSRDITESDFGKVLFINGERTITIPSMDTRGDFYVVNYAGGTVTVKGGTGVTLNGTSGGSVTISTQYKCAWVYPINSTTWICMTFF